MPKGVAVVLGVSLFVSCGRSGAEPGVSGGVSGFAGGGPLAAGGTRSAFDCRDTGQCPSGSACSPAGVCVPLCVPATCQELGKNCGTLPDGCGGTLYCGACATGTVCGAQSPNVCGAGTCQPNLTCNDVTRCGIASDGCGSVVACPDCPCGVDQKRCAGLCINLQPLIGCGNAGCDACPAPPPRGIAVCDDANECAVECMSGHALSPDGTQCIPVSSDAGLADAASGPESGPSDAGRDGVGRDGAGSLDSGDTGSPDPRDGEPRDAPLVATDGPNPEGAPADAQSSASSRDGAP